MNISGALAPLFSELFFSMLAQIWAKLQCRPYIYRVYLSFPPKISPVYEPKITKIR